MIEPAWLTIARKYIGVAETPGPATTPVIAGWLAKLRAWWTGDDVPWCGVFCAAVMQEAGIDPPRAFYRALAWAEWGVDLPAPALGCVVVYRRSGGGHVNFCAGVDGAGRIMGIGGNQGDRVSLAPFDRTRVVAYRWPSGYTHLMAAHQPPPLLASAGASSRNES